MLDESTLVLEGVTLAQVVELVVEVLVDLAAVTVPDKETAENTLAAHPEDGAVEDVRQSVRLPQNQLPKYRDVKAYLGIRASAVPFRFP